MSKAVLVIDMPKRCKDCFRYRADPWYGGRCTQAKDENGWNKKIEADEEYNVQNWCPLRPYEESISVEWILKRAKLCTADYANCLHYLVEAWQTEQKYMVNGQWKFPKDGEKENQSLE